MSAFYVEVNGGSSVRLPTAGKYCDEDIIVTAKGGMNDARGDALFSFCTANMDSTWNPPSEFETEGKVFYLEDTLFIVEFDDADCVYRPPLNTVFTGADGELYIIGGFCTEGLDVFKVDGVTSAPSHLEFTIYRHKED